MMMETGWQRAVPRACLTRSTVVLAVLAIIAVMLLPSVSAEQPGVPTGLPSLLASASTELSLSSAATKVVSQELTSAHAQYDGKFGYSVAISGSTVVVGAPFEKDGVGHAYLINITTGLVKTLNTPPAKPGGYQDGGLFGFSVAASGSTVVVGAPFDAAAGRGSTAGRAFTFSAGTGDLISTLVSPNAQGGGDFGWSVAISGTTVVVGAPGETVSGEYGAGHAYAFSAATGHLISTLTSPNAQGGGNFGFSAAISGTTVLVGAPFENASGDSEAGHAYTFKAATGSLISTLTSPNAQNYGWFGYSVGVSRTTVVVGAPYENASGEIRGGHAYTFNAATGDLISTLTSPHVQFFGTFGYAVGASDTTVVVGALYENVPRAVEAGYAYTFNAATGSQISTLISPNAQAYGNFGYGVAVSGTTVVVGAPFEKASGHFEAGHAYVF